MAEIPVERRLICWTSFLTAALLNTILAWRKVVSPFTGSRENCKKTVFALVSQTDEKKLYVKISLKNIENDSDNFESVTNEFEYCYIIKRWKHNIIRWFGLSYTSVNYVIYARLHFWDFQEYIYVWCTCGFFLLSLLILMCSFFVFFFNSSMYFIFNYGLFSEKRGLMDGWMDGWIRI